MRIPFTTHTYRGFMSYCDAETAKAVFKDMQQHGIKPTCHTYGALLDSERRAGNLSGMLKVIEMCINDGLQFDSMMCTSCLCGIEEITAKNPNKIRKYIVIAEKLYELSRRHKVFFFLKLFFFFFFFYYFVSLALHEKKKIKTAHHNHK